ncbi:RNA-directed DNA polymerase, eukaryota, reverse transcriptase zinc-binding domain protein [Tanacetum coccineum]
MCEVDINTLTMEQYLALTRGNQAPDHVERVLDIVSLSNIPGVTHDAVMLRVFPITLTRAAKGCQLCGGAHLDKECPLNEEVKSVEEVKYGKFGCSSPFNNGAKYHVGPLGYYILYANDDAPIKDTSSNETKKLHEVSFIADDDVQVTQDENDFPSGGLPCQLPPKEVNPRSFTLPCTIGSLDFYAMADLGASVNVMPKSIFEHLKLANLKKTETLVEMADMTRKVPIRIIKNALVQINNVFDKEISLEIGNDRVTFDMDKMNYNFTTHVEKVYMVNSIQDDDLMNIDYDLFLYESESCGFNSSFAIDPNIYDYDIDIQEPYEEIVYKMIDDGEPWEIKIVKETDKGFKDEEDDSEDKANAILGAVLDNLIDDWFNGTSKDGDDLKGIIGNLEPTSYGGFIDLNDKAYKERKCDLLGMTYRKPPPILIEKVKVTRYTIGPGETYTKVKVLEIKEMPRTRDNVATIRAGLMEEMGTYGISQGET